MEKLEKSKKQKKMKKAAKVDPKISDLLVHHAKLEGINVIVHVEEKTPKLELVRPQNKKQKREKSYHHEAVKKMSRTTCSKT